MSKPTADKLLSNCYLEGGCFVWGKSLNSSGYGQTSYAINGRYISAVVHKLVYEDLVGNILDGLVMDHLCRNRRCANPEHLEPVTMQENVLRGVGIAAINHKKSTCPQGHIYDFINSKGGRGCRKCTNRASKKWRMSKVGVMV